MKAAVTQAEAVAAKAEKTASMAEKMAAEAVRFRDRITNGEVMNAALILFGYTASSKLSKSEVHRRIVRRINLVYSWARTRQADLSEEKFRRMILSLDPGFENPWLRGRNDSAHNVTIAEAMAGANRSG